MENLEEKVISLQEERNDFVKSFIDSKASYQDLNNLFFFKKLAEMQIEIERLNQILVDHGIFS